MGHLLGTGREEAEEERRHEEEDMFFDSFYLNAKRFFIKSCFFKVNYFPKGKFRHCSDRVLG